MTKDVLKYLQPNAAIPIDMETTSLLVNALKERLAQPEQEPVATLEDLEQEIYQNTRNFISRDVMEWMLRRYYTHLPQPEQEPVVGTKTWFEDGKVITQYLHPSDIYIDPPQRTEQEPCVHAKNPKGCYRVRCQVGDKCVDDEMSFRTTPPQRKPLTDDLLTDLWYKQSLDWMEFARAIEAAHGIKD